jgi:hypothetical protein
MPDTAVYIYCILKSVKRAAMRGVPPGLPGASAPTPVDLGRGLWLIVTDVPLDIYGPGRLEAALRDMEWVGKIAMAHEAVVEHFTAIKGTTVIPAKLFTMFSNVDRAIADTRSRRSDIADAVKRIAGCEEWGVRVVRDPRDARQARANIRATSGAAFLAAKKRARDEKIEAALEASGAAQAVYETLSEHARDTRRRDDVPDNATTPPLLDAAFLVPATRRTRFKAAARRAAERCARSGANMTLSGPWPAYNFIQPDEDRR